jgi:hypothetical protein
MAAFACNAVPDTAVEVFTDTFRTGMIFGIDKIAFGGRVLKIWDLRTLRAGGGHIWLDLRNIIELDVGAT